MQIEQGEYRYAKINVPEDFKKDKDLVIEVSPELDHPKSDPNVFISTVSLTLSDKHLGREIP